MWAHPGKKLLFMGGEFGQWREWTETESLDWHLLEDSLHGGVQKLVRDLNRLYDPENALWEADGEPAGFEWIDVDNASENIVAFLRRSLDTGARNNLRLQLLRRPEATVIGSSCHMKASDYDRY